MALSERHSAAGPGWALFGSYPMRMMAALAASLLLIAVCFHLPFTTPPDPIGWHLTPDVQQPMLELIDIKEKLKEEAAGVPVTTFGVNEEDIEVGDDEEPEPEAESEIETEPLPTPVTPPIEKLRARPVLDYAEQMPDVAGGMGAYYIHIEYPQEAIDQGIEGRLILSFVVESDGTPTDIAVIRPLHVLCDSAAVRALRKTRFIPGQQNGRVVRVRMRLPVRFRLVGPDPADSTATATQSTVF